MCFVHSNAGCCSLPKNSLSLTCRLQELGIRTLIMSGDKRESVRSVAERIGISEADIYAELGPQDKQRLVGELRERSAIVAMVRDEIPPL